MIKMDIERIITEEWGSFEENRDSNKKNAIQILQKVLRLYPSLVRSAKDKSEKISLINNHLLLYSVLGDLYLKVEDYQSAISSFETAWAMMPVSLNEMENSEEFKWKIHEKVLVPLAQAYNHEGDYFNFRGVAEREKELFMTNIEKLLSGSEEMKANAWCDIGIGYQASGDLKKAIWAYKKAINQDLRNERARTLLLGSYGTIIAFRNFFSEGETKKALDNILSEFDFDNEIQISSNVNLIEIELNRKKIAKYAKQKMHLSKNSVVSFSVKKSSSFIESLSSYGLVNEQSKEIIKIYGSMDAAENEAELLSFFSYLGAPQVLGRATFGDLCINKMEFISGQSLYDHISLGVNTEKKIDLFEQAIDLLAEMQDKGLDIEGLDESALVNPEYFTGYNQGYLGGSVHTDKEGKEINVRFLVDINSENYSVINNILIDSAKTNPSFLVDFKLQNVYVNDNEQVVPLDLEKRRIFCGESDLVKLLRYGVEFEEWDDSFEYSAEDESGFNEAEDYIKTKRYLSEAEETDLIDRYYEKRNINFDDKRVDASMVHIHLFYVGWDERMISSIEDKNKQACLKNRQRYHLLEAKVKLDEMRNSNIYNSEEKEQFARLRKDLDGISITGIPE